MTELVDTPIVAVIDGCRHTTKNLDADEFTFLSNSSVLVEYKGVGECCGECSREGKGNVSFNIGINGHGFFCAAIIASPDFHNARVEKSGSSKLSNVSPPHIAIYAVGCPSCTLMSEFHVAEAIKVSAKANVNVISISLVRELPSMFVDQEVPDFHIRDEKILEVLRDGILVVLSSGNSGEYGLGTIQKSPPWCLTVASCTSYKKFSTTIEFASNAPVYDLYPLEGHSTSVIEPDEFALVRKKGNIHDTACVMYIMKLEGKSEIVIEASEGMITTNPMSLVHISKKTSAIISTYLDSVAAKDGSLLASFYSSSRIDLNCPLVSDFSSRGPCFYYKDFMKPDLCAPGENIVAPWPLEGGEYGKPGIARYAIRTGTSFSTPHVAAGVAIIMAEKKFSVSATISAAITTADKMHGKGLIGYEYEYGAGVFNLEKAMRPGLVYEEVADNFHKFFLGGILHSILNLPYFSATFCLGTEEKWICHFPRKMKSVEKGRCTYTADVVVRATTLDMPLQSIIISVDPKKLVFEDLDDEREFSLNVHLPHTKTKKSFGIISGSLIWNKEDDEKIVVDSPIILSSKDIKILLVDSQTS